MGIGRGRGVPRQPIVRRRPESPRRPIEPPFPQYAGFRLGQYRVVEERDDYLLCTGYNPNAKNPSSEVTPSAFRTGSLLKIAKPWALQRTIWEVGPIDIGGVEYTYEYSDDEYGVRTARWTDPDTGEAMEEEQRIDIPYVVGLEIEPPKTGDLIVAVEIQKNAGPVEGMTVTDEDGTRLRWIDLNVSGRHWKADDAIPTMIRFTIDEVTEPSHDSTEGEAEVTVNNRSCGGSAGNGVTVYDPLMCLLDEAADDLVGRKGFAMKMKNPSYNPDDPDSPKCRYEIIALCCPP